MATHNAGGAPGAYNYFTAPRADVSWIVLLDGVERREAAKVDCAAILASGFFM
ncbi:MAG: hypothetical protein IT297_04720 [Anaerolineae bacterium]|nr:hypothetical protein [Anaerolineae bacterium]